MGGTDVCWRIMLKYSSRNILQPFGQDSSTLESCPMALTSPLKSVCYLLTVVSVLQADTFKDSFPLKLYGRSFSNTAHCSHTATWVCFLDTKMEALLFSSPLYMLDSTYDHLFYIIVTCDIAIELICFIATS